MINNREPIKNIKIWKYFIENSPEELKDNALNLNNLPELSEDKLNDVMSALTSGKIKNEITLLMKNYDRGAEGNVENVFSVRHMEIIVKALESEKFPSDFTLDFTFSWLCSNPRKIELLANLIKSKKSPSGLSLILSQNYLHKHIALFSGAISNCSPNFKLFLRCCNLDATDIAIIAKEIENPLCQMSFLNLVDNQLSHDCGLMLLAATKKRSAKLEELLTEKLKKPSFITPESKFPQLELWLGGNPLIPESLLNEIKSELKKNSLMDFKESKPFQLDVPLNNMVEWSYVIETAPALLKNPDLDLSRSEEIPIEPFKKAMSTISSGVITRKFSLNLSKPEEMKRTLTMEHLASLGDVLRSGKYPEGFILNLTSACSDAKAFDCIIDAIKKRACSVGFQLNLSKNKIDATIIATIIKYCPTNFQLILDDCELSDTDIMVLAKEIENPQCNINYLSLANNKISDEGALMLKAAINNSRIKLKLNLSNNLIAPDLLAEISLHQAVEFKEIFSYRSRVSFTSTEAWLYVLNKSSDLLKYGTLDLSKPENSTEDDSKNDKPQPKSTQQKFEKLVEVIKSEKCPEGVTFNLSNNKICFTSFLLTLKQSPVDFRLIMDNCSIDDDDIAIIASQIGNVQSQLKYLSLKNNKITDEGAYALLSAVWKRAPGLVLDLTGNSGIAPENITPITKHLHNYFYHCVVMEQGIREKESKKIISKLPDVISGKIYQFLMPIETNKMKAFIETLQSRLHKAPKIEEKPKENPEEKIIAKKGPEAPVVVHTVKSTNNSQVSIRTVSVFKPKPPRVTHSYQKEMKKKGCLIC